ncbi:MAG: ergothioneine biosynthesis protein EgtB [Hyphomicrobiales bacterium]|nr:ergothioneine biosynthesis protein EgtB [Hyphomicrobiales bacterium]
MNEHVRKTPAPETRTPLAARLIATRRRSLDLSAPLGVEDMCAQAMDDASPTKWHLAHTTWFFETFVLEPFLPGYKSYDPRFKYCFNSYYESQGARQPRPRRGLLTRPTAEEVAGYRTHIDEQLARLLDSGLMDEPEIARRIELGVHHEEQHQELLLTDILALFAANPLRPAYRAADRGQPAPPPAAVRWLQGAEGVAEIGHDGAGFCFDNEGPRHKVYLNPHAVADRLVTSAEWIAFMDDGGYATPTLWLADGWARVTAEEWRAPLYWENRDGAWSHMTLEGMRDVDPHAPVCNISYFEADAFARWAGARLPSEAEWESAVAAGLPLRQAFGAVWQYTQSAYTPYPGFVPAEGALGEYNGKFMVSQQVLRGSSFATPPDHSRATYRNFFYPHQRWQFTGLRLAK